MAKNINIRETVFDMLMTTDRDGKPSHVLLSETLSKYGYLDKRDRAFISRLFKGTLEYQIFLDAVIAQGSSVTVRKMKRPVKILLRMGAYQILMMDSVPDRAACSETVEIAKKRGLGSLSGFINGVLRNISRNRDSITYPDEAEDPAGYISMRCSLPGWLVRMWLDDYDFRTVCRMGDAMLEECGTTVRVRNTSGGDITQTVQRAVRELQAQGIDVRGGSFMPDALRIYGYDSPGQLKAFENGRLMIQDESTMLAAAAAGVSEGDRIIDVCAAPGGKSIHMADLLGGTGHVSARDLTREKVSLISENIERTKVRNIDVMVRDARVFFPEDEESADIVMADVPCSGLGVMGRKPDIRMNMTYEKIRELCALQRDILSAVWRYVKPGGILIYSTCTVSKAENEDNVRWFTENFPFAFESMDELIPEKVRNDTSSLGWRQILPGEFDSDGFFIARMRRAV